MLEIAYLSTARPAFDKQLGQLIALNIAGVIGHRLQVVQAMWLREMQRAVNSAHA